MSIIAIGGGDLTHSIFDKILSLITTKRDGNLYIGLITDASFMTPKQNIEKILKGFNKQKRNYPTFKFIIENFRLLDYKNNKNDLTRYFTYVDILFMTGGHQQNIYNNISTLLKYNINIKRYFIDFLSRGGLLVGTSAGASILGPLMPPVLGKGIGLIGTIIDQHFVQNRRFNRGLRFVRDNPRLGLIGIDEDTMIIHNYRRGHIGKRYYKIFGDRLVVIISNIKGHIKVKVLRNGNSFYI